MTGTDDVSSSNRHEVWSSWRRVRDEKPLVHCITNYVSMDIMANTLLAVGASPAMVVAEEEIEEFAHVASALVLNVGTITPASSKAMFKAAASYAKLGKPWIIDPVAAGVSKFRMQVVLELLGHQPTLIRGNASEILAVAGASGAGGRGTDSTARPEEALAAGKQLARQHSCIVAISGATDLVTDGERVLGCGNGVPQMQLVTATGCTLTAVIAAFLAGRPADALTAAAHALCIYGMSAEAATDPEYSGPATLRTRMIDWLATAEASPAACPHPRLAEVAA